MGTTGCTAGLLALLLIAMPYALADEDDGMPDLTPQPLGVDPGDSFDLELSILAWENSSYTVTFQERSRFTYPGARAKTHVMARGDAILFKVPCTIDSDAPDGDFPIAFKVTWDSNGTQKELEGEVRVTVGAGSGSGDTCTTSMMVASISVLAISTVLVQQRNGRHRQR